MADINNKQISLLTYTLDANEDITKYRFIDFAGNMAESGEAVLGVAVQDCDEDNPLGVVIYGIVPIELGGTVTAGQKVMADSTDGKAVAWTSGNQCAGTVLEAGDSGDVVSMRIESSAELNGSDAVWTATADAAAGVTTLFTLPAGFVIEECYALINTLFESAGTLAVDVGVTDAATGLLVDINNTAADSYFGLDQSERGSLLLDTDRQLYRVPAGGKAVILTCDAQVSAGNISVVVKGFLSPI